MSSAARRVTPTVPDDVTVDVKAALPEEPWEVEGEDRVEMRVRVDALEARRVIEEVGEDKVVRRLEDGSVDLVLGVSSFASIRSWLLGLLDHVVITEPDAFRQALVAWLRTVAEAAPSFPTEAHLPEPDVHDGRGGVGGGAQCAGPRDEPAPAPLAGAGGLAGPGGRGAHRRRGAALRHE